MHAKILDDRVALAHEHTGVLTFLANVSSSDVAHSQILDAATLLLERLFDYYLYDEKQPKTSLNDALSLTATKEPCNIVLEYYVSRNVGMHRPVLDRHRNIASRNISSTKTSAYISNKTHSELKML